MRYISKKEKAAYTTAMLIDQGPEETKKSANETAEHYRKLFLQNWRKQSGSKKKRD